MNVWKLTSLCLATALVASIGMQSSWAAGVCFDQPNMIAARDHLLAARNSLERAEHNKGGWREAAVRATNTALEEVNRGCASRR